MKLLKAICVLGLSAVVYTAFVISYKYPDITITGREEYFLWVSLFMTGIAAVVLPFAKNIRFTPADISVSAMMIYTGINYVLSNSSAYSELLLFFSLGILYFNVRVMLSFYPGLLKWLIFLILISGIIESVIGIRQIYGFANSNHSLFKATGTFHNPGPYGGYLAVVFSIALWIAVNKYKIFTPLIDRPNKEGLKQLNIVEFIIPITAVAALILCFILLPATMSRSAWIAIIIASGYIAIVNTNILHRFLSAGKTTGRKIIIYAGSVLILATAFISFYKLKPDSADGRALMWRITSVVIKDNPITGVGLGNFRKAYADAQASYFENNHREKEAYVAGNPDNAFNEYLQLTAEGGIISLILFCIIIGVSLKTLIRRHNPLSAGMIALLVFALTSYPFHVLPLAILLALFAAAGNNNHIAGGKVIARIIFGFIICAAAIYYVTAIPLWNARYMALREYKSIKALYRLELYDDILRDYSEIYIPLRDEEQFLFEYGHSLNKSGNYDESNRILSQGIKLSNDPMFYNIMGNNYKNLYRIDLAAAAYDKAFHIVPNRVYPLYLTAVMYDEHNDTINAINACKRFLSITPKVASPATRDMTKDVSEILSKYE